jgi:S-DNA-T family DNA segregation ATPase FtsK/SpoIIIE
VISSVLVPVSTGSGIVVLISSVYWRLRSRGLGVGYWRIKGKDARRGHRDAAYVRRTWKPLAWQLKLYQKYTKPGRSQLKSGTGAVKPPRIKYPKLKRISSDKFGVTVEFELVPTVKLKDFRDSTEDLTNYWHMVRVSADQPESNLVRVRAVHRDPLIVKTLAVPTGEPETLRYYPAGPDEFGQIARIRLHHSSGIGVSGLPTFGKTSFIMGLITYLAPSASVAFLIADGKTSTGYEGDYMDVAPRALSVIGDDLFTFNMWIKQLNMLRRMRSSTIRQALGVRNFWEVGPTPEWPMIMPIIDEAHTYFEQVPAFGNPELIAHNQLAGDNAYQAADLVRKCQSVGIVPVFATQKETSDAMPTMLRDNLTTGVCFAVRTDEAAQAALGRAIRSHPDANPVNYQSEDYIGVATMMAVNRPGFVRFRSPYCRESVAADICERYAHLVQPSTCPGITIGQDHRAILAASGASDLLDIWQANGKS